MNLFKQLQWKLLLAVFKIKRVVEEWYGTRALDYSRRRLVVATSNIREYHTRAQSVAKEPATVAWIEHVAPGVVYDVGANVGAYSLIAAVVGNRVVAFEPLPENIRTLHENISLNQLEKEITVVPLLLGDRSGVERFAVRDTSSGASQEFTKAGEGMWLLAMTLDECVHTFRLPEPTALKIDVDGGEVAVLKGAAGSLKSSSLRTVMVEADDGNAAAVLDILAKAGFTKTNEVRMDKHTVNYFLDRA